MRGTGPHPKPSDMLVCHQIQVVNSEVTFERVGTAVIYQTHIQDWLNFQLGRVAILTDLLWISSISR